MDEDNGHGLPGHLLTVGCARCGIYLLAPSLEKEMRGQENGFILPPRAQRRAGRFYCKKCTMLPVVPIGARGC